MMGSIFYHSILMHRVLIKHVRCWDAFLIAMGFRNNTKIPEDEWKRYIGYKNRAFLFHLCGMALILILAFLF